MNCLKYAWFALIVLFAVSIGAVAGQPDEIERVFTSPPQSAKPGVLWMWMGCNLSKEGMTRDLEALKAAGFNRATVFSLADVTTPWAGEIQNTPTPEVIYWSEPWWALVKHAAQECKRLGIDFGMFNGPGYEASGGPWITPELSMQEVCSSNASVSGPGAVSLTLPKPTVDPRAVQQFPVYNPNTGLVEKPEMPERKTYYKDIIVLAMPADGVVAKDKIIDLTSKMTPDGKLDWTAPEGKCTVYRIGHTTMGTLMQPGQWKARALECDKMSVEAVRFHMKHVIDGYKSHLGSLCGTTFSHIHFDSYEAGTPGWTPKMREEFKNRRGYDMTPFLAAFAGRKIGSEDETNRFWGDYNATILDLFRDNYFAVIQKMLNEAGLKFLCEPYGGPWRQDEIMPKVDMVMTEFWTGGGRYSPYEVDPTIAALRKSGQNVVEAEAFTGSPGDSQWTETPAWLKPIGDAAYCAGINRFVLHRFPQQPWDDRYKPGATMGQWGTHFDRTQTWWEPGKAMVQYWQRCQALLQYGKIASSDFNVGESTGGLDIRSIHRHSAAADCWFVANTERSAGMARLSFKITGKQPELWDAVTGSRRVLTDFSEDNGETALTLPFAPTQSYFIVFRNPINASAKKTANAPELKPVSEITGSWQVSFDPKWGGPASVTFDKLEDWTARPEKGIKYYSGTATYTKVFDAPNPAKITWLDLGTVNCIARVRLNGKDLGVVWCAPWGVHLPNGVVQAKGNKLEIEVTNVWANRLIGDEQEPADCEWLPGHMGGQFLKSFPGWFIKGQPRPSKGRYCFTTWNYFSKDSALVPSGLLGPVRLMSEDWTYTGKDPFNTPLAIKRKTDGASASAFESDILKNSIPIAKIEDSGVLMDGGGNGAKMLIDGTTRNGSGSSETINDGKTFRGYGSGSVLTIWLDTAKSPSGYDLTGIRSFAGHSDSRASQSYTVLVLYAGDSSNFVKLTPAAAKCDGGSSELSITAKDGGILDNGSGCKASKVAAVRFEFGDGPLGFNVYREICIAGKPAK